MNNIFPLIGAGLGLLVSIKALLSKSDLEQVFLTQEQIIKLKLARIIGLSAAIGIIIADIYFIWSLIFKGKTFLTVDWNQLLGLAVSWFILGLMFISILSPIIVSIFSKYHFKYKVYIQDIGELYILKMMNQDVCICSKDPNSEIKHDDSESYLCSIEDIKNKPIIKMKIQRPQSNIQKLIKYNSQYV